MWKRKNKKLNRVGTDSNEHLVAGGYLSGEERESKSSGGNPTRVDEKRSQKTVKPYQLSTTRLLLLCFFTPILICAIAWFCIGFWPIGDRAPLIIDLYHQYVAFLSEFRDKLLHGQNFFFTWHIGLGVNFYSLMAYYVASPLNLLMILFPLGHVTDAVAALTLLKIGFSGLFTGIFIWKGYLRGEASRVSFESYTGASAHPIAKRRHGYGDYLCLAVSTAYAVSAYCFSYQWNIMWMDVVALFPLVLYGMMRLLRDGKGLIYIISLALTLFTNYYTAYFVILFLIVYFFVYGISILPRREGLNRYLAARYASGGTEEAPQMQNYQLYRSPLAYFVKSGVHLLIASLVGLGLSMFMTLPTYLSLAHTSASGDSFPHSHSFAFSILNFLTRNFIGAKPNVRDGLPNIYVGLLVLLILPLYILATRIDRREKKLYIAFVTFLFISFNSNVLNFIWHGFHYPNQLPHRFAFVFTMLILIIVVRLLMNSEARMLKGVYISAAILGGFLLICEEFMSDQFSSEMIYINLFFLLFYLSIFHTMKSKRGSGRSLALIFLVIFLGELLMNGILMVQQQNRNEYYTKRSDFLRDMENVEELIEAASEDNAHLPAYAEDSAADFYRLEYMPAKTTNDGALYHYNGFTLFASSSVRSVAETMRALGYHGNNINSYKFVASTKLMNAWFRIRYLILRDQTNYDPWLQSIDQSSNESQNFQLYRNDAILPFALALDPGIENWKAESGSCFALQNQLNVLGTQGRTLFKHLEIETEDLKNYTLAREDKNLGYAYNVVEEGMPSEINFDIVVPEDQYVYFWVRIVRKCDVHYEVLDSQTTEEGENVLQLASDLVAKPKTKTDEVLTAEPRLNQQRQINKPELFDCGYLKKGQVVRVRINLDTDLDNPTIWAAGHTKEAFDQVIENLRSRSVDLRPTGNSQITGTVNLDHESIVLMALPYDPSWQLTIDGKPGLLSPVCGGFTGIKLAAGTHEIEMNFIPEGFKTGLYISLASLVLLLIYLYMFRKRGPGFQAGLPGLDPENPDYRLAFEPESERAKEEALVVGQKMTP
ncbi:MAG: YfhO family protein, partial [Eubacteriales bacterium]|nr:YfhO family protein [Eubacteriales bacterium]